MTKLIATRDVYGETLRGMRRNAGQVLLFAVFTFILQPSLPQQILDNAFQAYQVKFDGLLPESGFQ